MIGKERMGWDGKVYPWNIENGDGTENWMMKMRLDGGQVEDWLNAKKIWIKEKNILLGRKI